MCEICFKIIWEGAGSGRGGINKTGHEFTIVEAEQWVYCGALNYFLYFCTYLKFFNIKILKKIGKVEIGTCVK